MFTIMHEATVSWRLMIGPEAPRSSGPPSTLLIHPKTPATGEAKKPSLPVFTSLRSNSIITMVHLRHLAFWLLCRLAWQCLAAEQAPLYSDSSSRHLALTDDLIAFHKNVTHIESITYNEEEVGNWLADSLESQGYTVEKQSVDEEAGRFNVYAYPGDIRETKILVSSHIDTVRHSQIMQFVQWH